MPHSARDSRTASTSKPSSCKGNTAHLLPAQNEKASVLCLLWRLPATLQIVSLQ